MYTNNKVFLVDILGMTNYCNLRCEYCDWEKFQYVPLTESEIQTVHKHLLEAKKFIKTHYPDAHMIEYSGGEPFMFPEIVMAVLDIFPEYAIRVITNATLLKPDYISRMAKHGRAYLGISLDGLSVESNHSRRISAVQLLTIFHNIECALSMGIPLMLLCTLNEDNVNEFFSYIDIIYQMYGKYVDSGQLALPAHMLASYSVQHRYARTEQVESFKKTLKIVNNPLVTRIREHYDQLFDYERELQCSINQWSTSMHFLGRSIATTGNFTTWRCGMRGVGKVGTFNVVSENQRDTFSDAMEQSLKTDFASFRCGCIIDWGPVDLVISGVIPMERAEEWFVLFRDEKVKAWINSHKKDFPMAYTRSGKMNIPAMCERRRHSC